MTALAPNLLVNVATGAITTSPVTADQQAASDAAAVAQQQAATDAATLRQAVVGQVQALVGVSWTAMTAAQKQALIVALLFKAGALDKTLTVQPLAGWL